MHKIIEKTYELLDCLDKSNLIYELEVYKNRSLKNKEIISLIKKYNSGSEDQELIRIKKELYSYNDYKKYVNCYQQLNDIVFKINRRYKSLLSNRRCSK